tara:strand:+ start:800 stop:1780 length:981 start_codon:yes stop_codon:yes gene_type:complete
MNDLEYAKNICIEQKKALKTMHSSMADRVLFKANQFIHSKSTDDGFWIHSTQKQTIKVTDDVSEAYLFLIKYLIKKACKYKGDKEATVDTYLTAVLNNKFTRNDWVKSISGGLTLPKAISLLSKEHQIVYRSLKHKHPIEHISSRINSSLSETNFIIEEVRNALSKEGKIDMIDDPQINSLVNEYEDNQWDNDFEDTSNIELDVASESENIKEVLNNCLNTLESDERRLLRMHWDARLTTKRIFEDYFKKADDIIEFNTIFADKESDIYINITRIIKKFDLLLKERYENFYHINDLSLEKTKKALKVIIENYDNSNENYWQNEEFN